MFSSSRLRKALLLASSFLSALECSAIPDEAFTVAFEHAIEEILGSSASDPHTPSPQSSSAPSNDTQTNWVFAHHIVGNTYNYTQADWADDISLASSKGIDAFALNVGRDGWETDQVANAYAAAKSLNTTFQLFLSLDMTSLPCGASGDASGIRQYIETYANHSNQFTYNNSVFLSTFSGESCSFGTNNANDGWTQVLRANMTTNVWFVPAFFVDPASFSNYTVLDGAFNWNGGWPDGNSNITLTSDETYLSHLGNGTYMGAVSPWFFTHYGVDTYNKNFIYRGDDWLWTERWELMVQNRTQLPFIEVISWNDFGESHYIGPIKGIQPMSESWVNGYDHGGWLDLMHYYVIAYKTGSYPAITEDRLFTWGRLYPANATAPDRVGKPFNYEWTEDYVWALAFLPSPANISLSCGNSTQNMTAPEGVTKMKLPLYANCSVNALIQRGDNVTMDFSPVGYNYTTSPPNYNYNAFVAASPR
ncbi:glycoside hydrolase family 71 protein [Panus rudis PR-1116 ss-1]|nr:glycoside hydrolase family 71 protein [Panus rudis PR-1116 ss-1]